MSLQKIRGDSKIRVLPVPNFSSHGRGQNGVLSLLLRRLSMQADLRTFVLLRLHKDVVPEGLRTEHLVPYVPAAYVFQGVSQSPRGVGRRALGE